MAIKVESLTSNARSIEIPSRIRARRVKLKIEYLLLQFNDKGRIDKKEWEKGIRFGMELLPSLHDEQYHQQVIDAQHRFAKRRYDHEFKWNPSRKMEHAIADFVFSDSYVS